MHLLLLLHVFSNDDISLDYLVTGDCCVCLACLQHGMWCLVRGADNEHEMIGHMHSQLMCIILQTKLSSRGEGLRRQNSYAAASEAIAAHGCSPRQRHRSAMQRAGDPDLQES
jgi:hypothetical protein